MMQGERSRTQLTPQDRQEALEREAVGIVPLGIPMLAGPGAITTVMVLMATASAPIDMAAIVIILASIFSTLGVTWILLMQADRVFHRIGRMGAYAISRIMGLILAAIAVQFIILGVQGAVVEFFLPLLRG